MQSQAEFASTQESTSAIPKERGTVLGTEISFKRLEEIPGSQTLGQLGDLYLSPWTHRKGNTERCKQPGRFLECVRDNFGYGTDGTAGTTAP